MASVTYDKATRLYPGGNRPAVDSLDLDVADGEFLVLVGPSGCGKSTSLRMLAGLEEVNSGAIRIGDRDVTDVPPKDRDIAMVFQNYALYPHMTVAENMGFALKIAGVGKEERATRVQEAAKLLDLEQYLGRKPKALSGGQRQRVAMGRAIVRQPQVFLMDEPLSNLDAKLRVSVRDEIRRIQQRLGITTVIVTHDQDEALSISDRIAVMHDGRIEQVASPTDLYARPSTRFVASFIGATTSVTGAFLAAVRTPVPAGDEVLVRPEEVVLTDDGPVRATVSRVLMRGHFAELVLRSGDAELRAYVTGPPPPLGTETGVRIGAVLVYRDGVLTEVAR
ncbi:ABC transporter ATP-binding protein [Curtobacterium herbarum]|uniref:ABC transporter ATP-binding protein n=1 Tax=Curtobacterium herbarum TaxID=150122 RepID=UPI001C8D0575|nr:ATP-binding cassette domain-containing protein [Curtobacterium herbarum]MBY0176971.1 ATP-binding cassette domain-containing protein [Curtobacterium herbarum]